MKMNQWWKNFGLHRMSVDGKSDMRGNSRQIEENRSAALRALVFAAFFGLGAITTGGLANLIFNGWVVALIAISGGVWGMSIAAFCQVGTAEHGTRTASIPISSSRR